MVTKLFGEPFDEWSKKIKFIELYEIIESEAFMHDLYTHLPGFVKKYKNNSGVSFKEIVSKTKGKL